MDNYKEFLTIARSVIVSFISEEKRNEQVINFFLKEATDHQILSVLVENKIPLKYDSKNEKKLMNELYTQLSYGVTYLTEQDAYDKAKTFVMTVPTAPLLYPAAQLLKSIGSISGASAIATKVAGLTAGGTAAAITGGIGTLVLVALLVYAAFKTYARFFSKAARNCKGLSGKAKTKCILKYKLEGRRKQYNDLASSSRACSKSKQPVKCNRIMDEKTRAVQKKINKLKEKLEEVMIKR